MRRNEEDEIQVLGTSPRKRGSGKALRIGVWVLCVILGVGGWFCFFYHSEKEARMEEEKQEMEQPVVIPVDSLPCRTSSVGISVDSINDVKMQIYVLDGLSAGLSFELPEKSDTTVFLAVQAADIRRDNGGIVGDFVIRGERYARGKRKSGYCAIGDGRVVLGNSTEDEVMERCLRQQGDFFRQYPLVMNGEIQENRLKGKAIRRALARQGDHLCFVESCNRESVYDFAEALADYGFSDALYLVGGSAYGWWREDGETVHELGHWDVELSKSSLNYLIFRLPESH